MRLRRLGAPLASGRTSSNALLRRAIPVSSARILAGSLFPGVNHKTYCDILQAALISRAIAARNAAAATNKSPPAPDRRSREGHAPWEDARREDHFDRNPAHRRFRQRAVGPRA